MHCNSYIYISILNRYNAIFKLGQYLAQIPQDESAIFSSDAHQIQLTLIIASKDVKLLII